MSAYIKFMFKYLFEATTDEAVAAAAAADEDARLRAAGGGAGGNYAAAKVDAAGFSALLPALEPGADAPSAVVLAHQVHHQPVNYSSDNMTSSSSSSSSSVMVNKSLAGRLLATTGQWLAWRDGSQEQQQQQPQPQQLQSADSGGGGNSKLWPPNCLGYARLFAMAQNSQQQQQAQGQQSSASQGAGPANGTTTMVSGGVGQPSSNGLLARLGSFAEFEHLIRRQLAGGGGGSGGTAGSGSGPPRTLRAADWADSAARLARARTLDALRDSQHQQAHERSGGGITSAFYSSAAAAASNQLSANSTGAPLLLENLSSTSPTGQQSHGGNLLRLLIRSIGHANATSAQTSNQHVHHQELQQSAPVAVALAPVSWQHNHEAGQQAMPTQGQVNSLELLECYNQLQLSDYYAGYDIFIGLRIATTLSILFIVFILFVIYKTGCRADGERSSRSQLRLTSSGVRGNKKPAASSSGHRRDKSSSGCGGGSPLSSSSSAHSLSLGKRHQRGGAAAALVAGGGGAKRRKEQKYLRERERERDKEKNTAQSQQKQQRQQKEKINSAMAAAAAGGNPYHCGADATSAHTVAAEVAASAFSNNTAHADAARALEPRTNRDARAAAECASESLISERQQSSPSQQQEQQQCPSVMVLIEGPAAPVAFSAREEKTRPGRDPSAPSTRRGSGQLTED